MPIEDLSSLPTISVIIPTHNRKDTLKQSLSALNQQTYPLEKMEVIVVADGCHDGTWEMLSEFDARFSLQIIELAGCGASCARNTGASKANGEIIMFLDDDVEPTSELVEMHVKRHQKQTNLAVIGHFIPKLEVQSGFFRIELRIWWENMFDRIRATGHRFNYQDLLTGNVSLARALFIKIGGFDENFVVHEDYEFGYRLIVNGTKLDFCDQARSFHYEKTNIEKALKRKFNEGKADVMLGKTYPELIPTLLIWNLNKNSFQIGRMIRFLAFRLPFFGNLLMAVVRIILQVFEGFRLRSLWRATLDGLMAYWYWRGASQLLDFPTGYKNFLKDYQAFQSKGPKSKPLHLDLAQGLPTVEALLDQLQPHSAVVTHGSRVIGLIPDKPGAEQLRGAHLRETLAEDLAQEMSWFLSSSSIVDAIQTSVGREQYT